MVPTISFAVQRIYQRSGTIRGHRVLVDRLWPRGIRRDEAALSEWCKDVAPSDDLRRWYGHDPERFDAFARRYRVELTRPPASGEVARLRALGEERRVILVTATRDVAHSGAAVLRDLLRSAPEHDSAT
jgi:uncharacterized protein YeaO (DUF488 family)